MREFNSLLVVNKVKTYMNTVYVDDQSWAGRALRRGVRWDMETRLMLWKEEWEREDETRGESGDKRTFRELRVMGNTISNDIKMKEDVPSENLDGKLPVLDTKMWVERGDDNVVSHLVTMKRSSLPIKIKITVLSQEYVRWKRNTW